MESSWKNEGHKSTSKTYVLVHAKSSVMRQKRVEQQRGFEQHLGKFAYLSIPFSIELESVPEIENWRTVSSFWNSFQPFLLPFSHSLYFLLPFHKESEKVLVSVTILCVLEAFNNKLMMQECLFPTRNKVGNTVCVSTAQGAHSGSAGKGGSEVLPDNASGANPKSICKCIMGIRQSLILKSVCLGISWRLHFEWRLSTEKMREILRIKLFPSNCGTNVRFHLESETKV